MSDADQLRGINVAVEHGPPDEDVIDPDFEREHASSYRVTRVKPLQARVRRERRRGLGCTNAPLRELASADALPHQALQALQVRFLVQAL